MASTLLFLGVLAVDFVAFGLALLAEQMRSNALVVVDSDHNYCFCDYEPNIATSLGIAASGLLLASQLYTFLTTRCFCFEKGVKPGGSNVYAVILSIITWITFFMAEACLLWGSVKNAQHTKYRTIFAIGTPDCQTLQKGVFEAGAALILITSMVSKFNHICCSNSAEGCKTDNCELGTYNSLG